MIDDSDFPRLTPPDDNYPGHDGLLRKPEDLTDEQFDLLAAAWSEEALAGDQLSELEVAMTAIPSRRMRAESFRRVKLAPFDDKWAGRNRLLRQSPATGVINRTLVITLLSAAAVVVFIIAGPAIKNRISDVPPGALPEGTAMSEAIIPRAYPVIIPDRGNAEPAGANRVTVPERTAAVPSVALTERTAVIRQTTMTEPEMITPNAGAVEPARALPVSLEINEVYPVMIAAAGITDIQAVQMADIIPAPAQDKADNWIIRGLSLLAKSVTKEENKIDGYFVASACVNGINNVLGWEMQLEQANNKSGKPVAVNFSSSLLSFSAPVNKNSP